MRRLVAQWEHDPQLFEPDQLLRRFDALDVLDRHYADDGFPAVDFASGNLAQVAEILQRVKAVRVLIEAANERVFEDIRGEIRRGDRAELLRWAHLAAREDGARPTAEAGYAFLDELISGVFRFEEPEGVIAPAEPEMVAYQPTPARHIFDLIEAVPLKAEDVLIDLGAGLGHVPLTISICTSARAVGIELEAGYVERARQCARELNLKRVAFLRQDARAADLSAGTVFYLYTPFTGSILRAVLDRLREEGRARPIRVCTYGPCTPVVAQESWLETTVAITTDQVAFFRPRKGC